jgi:hypothetical protein
MIHRFEVRGFMGVATVVGVALMVLGLVAVLPGMLLQFAWNTALAEVYPLPQVALYQGILMWLILVSVILLVFRPRIEVRFQAEEAQDLPAWFVAQQTQQRQEAAALKAARKASGQEMGAVKAFVSGRGLPVAVWALAVVALAARLGGLL